MRVGIIYSMNEGTNLGKILRAHVIPFFENKTLSNSFYIPLV